MFALLLACAVEPDSGNTRKAAAAEDDSDLLGGEGAVRVLSPANGETVDGSFTLSWRAGTEVKGLRLDADGATIDSVDVSDSEGSFVVTLEEGRHELSLVGLSAAGAELSHDDLTVRVDTDGSWVTITSPSDGAEVANPVTFAIATSADISSVTLSADGWPIGTVDTAGDGEGSLTYSFSGTGYARAITAESADGSSTDSIGVTVTPEENPTASSFNDVVWSYLLSYPTDGTHGYYWPSGSDWSGTTRDIWYQDVLVAEGDPQGRCYCVGITWEVFMRAWADIDQSTGGDGSINGMNVDDLYSFRTDWFVREVDGPGPSVAMDNYGVGEEITDVSKLLPGDFVQFWRHSGSGHNVIFVDWIEGGGEIIGIEYWSTQSSTDGIGYNQEYFGSSGSYIDRNLVYAARGWMPEDWLAWN
jgi:hypothetical protein